MPAIARKSRAEWESQRERIIECYTQNTLQETAKPMRDRYDFDATPKELRTRLEAWGITKNLKKDQWKFVHQRNSMGVPISIQVNGTFVSEKRKNRAIGRYSRDFKNSIEPSSSTSLANINSHGVEPPSNRGIAFRTLLLYPHRRVKTYTIPGLRFLEGFAAQWTDMTHAVRNGGGPNPSIPRGLFAVCSMQDARHILKEIIDLDDCALNSLVNLPASRLHGYLRLKSHTDDQPISYEPLALLLQLYIYLSSNHSLSLKKMDLFLRWILQTESMPVFYQLIAKLREDYSQIMEIFLSRLLSSAVNLEQIDIVSTLLRYSVEPNFSKFRYPQEDSMSLFPTRHLIKDIECPLQLVILKSNFRICSLLVKNPFYCPDANANSEIFPFSPFETAISMPRVNADIVNLLFDIGADINLSSSHEITSIRLFGCSNPSVISRYTKRTPLMKAVEAQNTNIVATLLQKGAHVNDISEISGNALQIAVAKNDIEVVDILIEAKAEVEIRFDTLEELAKRYFIMWLQEASCDGYFTRVDYALTVQWGAFYSPIQMASKNDNLVMVKRLLKAGATVNNHPNWDRIWNHIRKPTSSPSVLELYEHMKSASKPYFQSALHESVANGNIVLTGLLLQEGASVDNPNALGMTALQIACDLDQSEFESEQIFCLVELLIKYGADIYAPSNIAALQTATRARNPCLMRLFSSYGITSSVDIEWVEAYNAASSGDLATVHIILQKGMDVNTQSTLKDIPEIQGTFLTAATEAGHILIARELLEAGAQVDVPAAGETALCMAVRRRDWDITCLLLAHKANINARDSITPLAQASFSGMIDMVEKLIEAGADVHWPSLPPKYYQDHEQATVWKYATPIFWALIGYDYNRCGSKDDGYSIDSLEEMMLLLVSHGANLNTESEGVGSVLGLACRYLSVSTVKSLINGDFNVNLPDPRGVYPIQSAAERGSDMLSLLIDAGADICAPENLVWNIYSVTRIIGPAEQKKMMLKLFNARMQIKQQDRLLVELIMFECLDAACQLVKAGVNVNTHYPWPPWSPPQLTTSLCEAARKGCLNIVRLLVDYGADVNPSVSQQPLYLAALGGHFTTCKYLVENGSDINSEDSSGHTTLQMAAMTGRLDIVHLLLENDEELNMIHSRCKEAALHAARNGHNILARFLRTYTPNAEQGTESIKIDSEVVIQSK